eukprot:gene65868-90129_t
MIGYSAFIAEIFRAGFQSIDKGQIEASMALGLSRYQRFRLIVFPQAIRVIFPPLSNDFVAMVKDSSLVSVLGVADITQMGKIYASASLSFSVISRDGCASDAVDRRCEIGMMAQPFERIVATFSRLRYYATGIARRAVPAPFFCRQREDIMACLDDHPAANELIGRVNYCNRLSLGRHPQPQVALSRV